MGAGRGERNAVGRAYTLQLGTVIGVLFALPRAYDPHFGLPVTSPRTRTRD